MTHRGREGTDVERSRRTLRDHARRIRRNYAIRSRTRRLSRRLEANPASARRDLRNFRASRSPAPPPPSPSPAPGCRSRLSPVSARVWATREFG